MGVLKINWANLTACSPPGRPARLPLDGDALPDRLRRLRAAALGRDVLVHACHGHVLHRR